ncbi:carbohydrate ABC transporter permease [Paenibacillus doosanensis]|uniref:Lactose transport system permease protein LacG n=1 Tax=Paenibacillus konkukensis TaxID=2020716 RepID=A0ABY4RWI7_9BACL|nr:MULTISPECIES: carbohydrate ABC transporter permease [Paenibacillus]MCS7458960.1 carbohydrate ABC transporter permease [Paenibacillus doosanensis]UQZ86507.1 Lactose transport system permease protein LacG [Paenibacillus konkukensis]
MQKIVRDIKNSRFDAHTVSRWLTTLKHLFIGKEADKGLIFRLFMYLILIDVAFIYIKPILYMITTMIKDSSNLLDPAVIWVPRSFFMGHLEEAFRLLKYSSAFWISMTVALSVAVLQVISCAVAGYAFARLEFPLKKFWFVCLIFTFVMPPQVTILPSILLFKDFGWINTYLPLIVPAIFGHGLKGALFVIIYRQFFSTLPKELEEAAKMDGASVFRVFFRVMLPISTSAIIVVFLFSFVWNWNDFYYPTMYMFGAKEVPLSISLSRLAASLAAEAEQSGPSIFAEPIKMAASFLIIMPVLVVYMFTQRWFVEGVERTGLVE